MCFRAAESKGAGKESLWPTTSNSWTVESLDFNLEARIDHQRLHELMTAMQSH